MKGTRIIDSLATLGCEVHSSIFLDSRSYLSNNLRTSMMEQNLWLSFKKGDKKAFASIYNLYTDELFFYGTKLCSDVALVKDSIQDIFIDLFEHKNQLSEPRNIKYYLFKVLKRTIFKKLKKEQRYLGLSELQLMSFTTVYNFESRLIEEEVDDCKKKFITQALNELTSKQQEILYLRFTMGFNYLEIAKIVQINHNSVRKQVYRAIKNLRESTAFKHHTSFIFFYSSLY